MSDISLSLMGLVYYIHLYPSNMNPRWWQLVYPCLPPWTGESAKIQATAKDYYRDLSLASDDKWRLFDAVGTEVS